MHLKQEATLQSGKYRIVKVLGQGGFGITYLAEQDVDIKGEIGTIKAKIKVTIKEFFMREHCNRDADTSFVSVPSIGSQEMVGRFKTKFIKEAQNISKLNHDNIVKVFDIFEENGTAYYVMEYIDGGSLNDRIAEYGTLSEAEALHYVNQIANALKYIHNKKINHLDVKPSNILIKEGAISVLIDFGLAKQYDSAGDQTSSTPVGVSKGYAPMEQYKAGGVSSFSPSTDIYSLGATLYKLVTGKTPPEAHDIMEDGVPELSEDLSNRTKNAITQAMQHIRKNRPQSVAEFTNLLNLDSETTTIVEQDIKPSISSEKDHIENTITNNHNFHNNKVDNKHHKDKKNKAPVYILIGCIILAIIGAILFMPHNNLDADSYNNELVSKGSLSEFDSLSYAVGVNITTSIKSQMTDLPLDFNVIKESMIQSVYGQNTISHSDAITLLEDYFKNKRTKRADAKQPMFESNAECLEISAAIGNDMGHNIVTANFPIKTMWLEQAFNDVVAEKSKINENDANSIIQNYFTTTVPKNNKISSEKWLSSIESQPGVKKTSSGLLYKIETSGSSSIIATKDSDVVKVKYTGKKRDGQIFDSSRDEIIELPLNKVIAGWTEGMKLVGKGGHISLWIPSDLAYGEKGAGSNIGANEALYFDVEIIDVIHSNK